MPSSKETGVNENGAASGLPSFFFDGPPRTATTWLHAVLSECAWLSYPTKETHFFDRHFDRRLAWFNHIVARETISPFHDLCFGHELLHDVDTAFSLSTLIWH